MKLRQPCVKREAFINRIRGLGYSFNRRGDKVEMWRRKGSSPPHFIPVPRKNLLAEAWVRSALQQTQALTNDEIETFIANNRT